MTYTPYVMSPNPNITGIAQSLTRTTLSLNQGPTGAINVGPDPGIDWGEAQITAYEAEQETWGSTGRRFRVPNRIITIPLLLGGNGAAASAGDARQELHEKVALIQREGGWFKRQRRGRRRDVRGCRERNSDGA